MTLSNEEMAKISEEEEYREFIRFKLNKQAPSTTKPRKDPALAALLSLIIPGAGQIYVGRLGRGLLILFTSWLIIPWLIGIFDAYSLAKSQEREAI